MATDTKTPKEIAELAIEMGHARASVLRGMQGLNDALKLLDTYKATYAKLTAKKTKLIEKVAAGNETDRLDYTIWFDEKVGETARAILKTPPPPHSLTTKAAEAQPSKLPAPATSYKKLPGNPNAPTPVDPAPDPKQAASTWQTWPAWDPEKHQAPVTRYVSAELLDKYRKAYSADSLFQGNGPRSTFDYDSATYVCVGVSYGAGGSIVVMAYEMVPKGDYMAGGGQLVKRGGSLYEGNVVMYDRLEFVLTRPVTFCLEEETPEAEEEIEAAAQAMTAAALDVDVDVDVDVDAEAEAAVGRDGAEW